MSNDTVQDWAAILDDDEYTWSNDDPVSERDGGEEIWHSGFAAGWDQAERLAELKHEEESGMVLVAYGVFAFCGAMLGAVGMKLLMVWGG